MAICTENPQAGDFDLLTLPDVALLLHCLKAHVCNAVNGRLEGCSPIPAVRLGRRVLVRRESLERWLQQNEGGSSGRIGVSPEGRARKHALRRSNA